MGARDDHDRIDATGRIHSGVEDGGAGAEKRPAHQDGYESKHGQGLAACKYPRSHEYDRTVAD